MQRRDADHSNNNSTCCSETRKPKFQTITEKQFMTSSDMFPLCRCKILVLSENIFLKRSPCTDLQVKSQYLRLFIALVAVMITVQIISFIFFSFFLFCYFKGERDLVLKYDDLWLSNTKKGWKIKRAKREEKSKIKACNNNNNNTKITVVDKLKYNPVREKKV